MSRMSVYNSDIIKPIKRIKIEENLLKYKLND